MQLLLFEPIFSEFTGIPIGKFHQLLRVKKAAELLKSGRFNVSEASLEVGYNSLSHFSKAFTEVMGCRPSEFSRGE